MEGIFPTRLTLSTTSPTNEGPARVKHFLETLVAIWRAAAVVAAGDLKPGRAGATIPSPKGPSSTDQITQSNPRTN